jgi:hypothetical protein
MMQAYDEKDGEMDDKKKTESKKEAPVKEATKKEAPVKEASKKEAPVKEASKKQAPVKEVSKKEETDFTNKRQNEYNILGNLTNQVKMNKLPGPPINSNLVQSFLSGGKDVDDMQDELKDMLFGEGNSKNGDYIGKPISRTTNNLTQSRFTNQRKPGLVMIDGDRAEFDDYDRSDYDMYSYDNKEDGNRRMDTELPQPPELKHKVT